MPLVTLSPPGINIYPLEKIYDPDVPPAQQPDGQIIPKPLDLVIESPNIIWSVVFVDPDTHRTTLEPTRIQLQNDSPDIVSMVSYGNDIFTLYYDTRTTPMELHIDSRATVSGAQLSFYRLVRDVNGPAEEIISRYYDAAGLYVGAHVPMRRVADDANTWYGEPCYTGSPITDGEMITMQIFNEAGTQLASWNLHAKASTIINELNGYTPVITDMTLSATQMRSNGEVFAFTKQSVTSLGITARLVYDNGQTLEVPIDNHKTFLYGLEDFNPSYAGLRQTLLLKYMLAPDEPASPTLTNGKSFISKQVDIVVVENELMGDGKLSAIPVYMSATGAYRLIWRWYTTDRNVSVDVSPYVTIEGGTFVGTTYGTFQRFTARLDLNAMDPVLYPDVVYHRQTVNVRLQPSIAYERYLLKDAESAPLVYGVDQPTQRRPIIRYSATTQTYYVPSSIFLTTDAFLLSFYDAATPPYKPSVESGPLAPTHFIVRDALSGLMVTAMEIDVANYMTTWPLLGNLAPDAMVGKTVIVEFLHITAGGTRLILYGVPVDVVAYGT